jgi:putative Mg2+ transporter-C (MgtC) family protein
MISNYQIFVRLLIATLLSGLIGFEREYYGKAAGFRTHILVCVGSTLMMLTSMHIFEIYRGIAATDPARIASQVVAGMGFLGAGTILRSGTTVKGLTTAASLWAVAGIGLAVGCGFYFAAFTTTAFVFITLVIFSKMEEALALKGEKKGGDKQ